MVVTKRPAKRDRKNTSKPEKDAIAIADDDDYGDTLQIANDL